MAKGLADLDASASGSKVLCAGTSSRRDDTPSFNSEVFDQAADAVYSNGSFDYSLIADPAVRNVIRETFSSLNTAISSSLPEECPATLRYALEENAFVFSGFKTFHAMREIGLSMVTDKGTVKPYEDFKKDVQKINATYNTNYLHAEYYHALGSAQMAEKWLQIEKDGDRYDLQYRTAQDDHVREDHALLDGITLPVSDPFWEKYFPPNGWGCRCTAVQVRKGKYPLTDPQLAMQRGDNATQMEKQKIFRFNPGKELKLFPPKHPYYKTPEEAKNKIQNIVNQENRKQQAGELIKWMKKNLPTTTVGKFPSQRFVVDIPELQKVVVNKVFYNEIINKYKNDELYIDRLLYARRAHLLIPFSKRIRQENANDHPDAYFLVYQYNDDDKYIIEFKIKINNDGAFLYYMRLYKK